jgi:hypothetical protein
MDYVPAVVAQRGARHCVVADRLYLGQLDDSEAMPIAQTPCRTRPSIGSYH